MAKYAWLRERVAQRVEGVVLQEAPPADDDLLMLAHSAQWVAAVRDGQLTASQQQAIGFPWSPAMVERSRRSVGATVAALRVALADGAAVNLAGGTHHAHADEGSGFCVFNDIAVAARSVQQTEGSVGRRLQILVIDLDVHQGDGTASITQDDASIFTFSMQGRENFPFTRQRSDLDVELPSGCGDEEYLRALDAGLQTVASRFQPDAVIYVAGADVHGNDRLGKLAISDEGMEARDHTVFGWCLRRGLPVAMCMAGGYGRDLSAMVDLQVGIVSRLAEYRRQWQLLHVPVHRESP